MLGPLACSGKKKARVGSLREEIGAKAASYPCRQRRNNRLPAGVIQHLNPAGEKYAHYNWNQCLPVRHEGYAEGVTLSCQRRVDNCRSTGGGLVMGIVSFLKRHFGKKKDLDDKEIEIAKGIYENNRYYHGTTPGSKSSIQKHGFTKKRKTDGATKQRRAQHGEGEGQRKLETTAAQHHYLTTDKDEANFYATIRTGSHQAFARVLGSQQGMDLHADPDSYKNIDERTKVTAFRTEEDIPARHVLRSRGRPSRANGSVFRDLLRLEIPDVSADKARQLLERVQTNSEDDLPKNSLTPILQKQPALFRPSSTNSVDTGFSFVSPDAEVESQVSGGSVSARQQKNDEIVAVARANHKPHRLR